MSYFANLRMRKDHGVCLVHWLVTCAGAACNLAESHGGSSGGVSRGPMCVRKRLQVVSRVPKTPRITSFDIAKDDRRKNTPCQSIVQRPAGGNLQALGARDIWPLDICPWERLSMNRNLAGDGDRFLQLADNCFSSSLPSLCASPKNF